MSRPGKVLPVVAAIALLVGSARSNDAQQPKGTLFIIGGGHRSIEMMQRFVALAGGADRARIVVIPNASGDGDTSCWDMAKEFHALGVREVNCCLLDREQASDPRSAEKLDGATAIYFTGGDQSRVTKALAGTPVQKRLLELYRDGAVIGGTSAGAALMSQVMITGDERLNADSVNAFHFIRKDNIVTIEGMGFLDDAIIDQHFITRKRHNRLISVVLEHPNLVGVGIDEATAIILRPGGSFEVTGEGSVIVYDATHAAGIRTDQHGNLSAHDVVMHLLVAGDGYDLRSHTVHSASDRK
ncbi:MAG TPA: cyanophycinase [Bacteroidota bacterium]|nr:cyanophycinase [Bacteroidota bacterium]